MSEYQFSSVVSKMKASKIRELLKHATTPGMISFAGGLPDPDNFPSDDVRSIINKWDEKKFHQAMQYGATDGFPPLIELLQHRMTDKGINTNDQKFMVTAGGQQAIFLLAKVLVDIDDTIIIEEPSFIGAVAAFLSNGAMPLGIPVEDDGMDIGFLENVLAKSKKNGNMPKFIYTIPNFHNPMGVTLSQEKRKRLYDLSIQYDIPVIEDDPYGDLYFNDDSSDCKPIKAIGNEAKIIYVSSFSKILCPGFRIGWMIGDESILDKSSISKQSIDACSSTFGQIIAYDYLASSSIDNYLEKMRKVYREKKEKMLTEIKKCFPREVEATNPGGGFYIYLTLPDKLSASKVFEAAIKKKVAFVTGEPFHIDTNEGDKHIRLSFSNSSFEKIEKGVKILGEVIHNQLKNL